MKIALVTYALQVGGIESVLLSLAEHFTSKGHDVTFVETSSKGAWSDEFAHKGYEVQSIIIGPFETRLQHVKRLAKHLSQYDVLLLNDAPFAQSVLGLLPLEIITIPILHTDLNSMMHNASSNTGQWDKIVCVSSGLYDSLQTFMTKNHDRTMVISNGVNVPGSWIKENKLPNETLQVCFLGRVENNQKGVLLIPDIAQKVLQHSSKIHFNIIGNGPSFDALKSKIEDYKLTDHFTLHGSKPHDEAVKILMYQDILLMPSNFEGHPIALLEAMSYGVVPVATNLKGQIDHVIFDSKNGYLCSKNNSSDFATKLQILFDNNLRKLFSNAAWKTVHEMYSTKIMGDSYLKLIDELKIANKKVRHGKIDLTLLGDLYYLPISSVRIVRKLLRILGIWDKYIYFFTKAIDGK